MKKRYTEIEMELLRFDSADIVATSGGLTLAGAFDELNEDKAGFGDLF